MPETVFKTVASVSTSKTLQAPLFAAFFISLRQAVSFDRLVVRNGGKESAEILSPTQSCLASQIIERRERRHFFGGGAGKKLVDRVAFSLYMGLNAAMQGIRNLDG